MQRRSAPPHERESSASLRYFRTINFLRCSRPSRWASYSSMGALKLNTSIRSSLEVRYMFALLFEHRLHEGLELRKLLRLEHLLGRMADGDRNRAEMCPGAPRHARTLHCLTTRRGCAAGSARPAARPCGAGGRTCSAGASRGCAR